jgi:hypothetical protein
VQIGLAVYLLFRLVHWSLFAGLAVVVCAVMPINFYVTKLIQVCLHIYMCV